MIMPWENNAKKKNIVPSRELINSMNMCQKVQKFGNDTKNHNCSNELIMSKLVSGNAFGQSVHNICLPAL
jgi:hypothetical protein